MSERPDVVREVVAILDRYRPKGPPASEGSVLIEGLGLNSTRLVECLLDLEDRFDVRIEAREVLESRTVGDLVDVVLRAL